MFHFSLAFNNRRVSSLVRASGNVHFLFFFMDKLGGGRNPSQLLSGGKFLVQAQLCRQQNFLARPKQFARSQQLLSEQVKGVAVVHLVEVVMVVLVEMELLVECVGGFVEKLVEVEWIGELG